VSNITLTSVVFYNVWAVERVQLACANVRVLSAFIFKGTHCTNLRLKLYRRGCGVYYVTDQLWSLVHLRRYSTFKIYFVSPQHLWTLKCMRKY